MPEDKAEPTRNGISMLGNDKVLLLRLRKYYLDSEHHSPSTSAIYREGLRALAEKLGVCLDTP